MLWWRKLIFSSFKRSQLCRVCHITNFDGLFQNILRPLHHPASSLRSHHQQVQLSSQILFELRSYHHCSRAEEGSTETLVPQSDLHDWSRNDVSLCRRQSRMSSTLLASPAPLNPVECQNIKGQIWEMEILWKGLKHAQRFYH